MYTVVIPVYNSAGIVGQTIDRTVAFFETQGWSYELILVNDGSHDGSWDVVRQKAVANPRVVAINLLKNYGQHTAVFCGLQASRGDYVITMDDDLQNPPEEIVHLVHKAAEGHDVVFGRFHRKQHAGYRRIGSRLIRLINQRVFRQPQDLVLTNFRLLRRQVVDRICGYRTQYPYITGLAIMFAGSPANTWVEHHDTPLGRSGYTPLKITELVMRILFNYSPFPLRLVALLGLVVSVVSFALGGFYLILGLRSEVGVPGWTTLVVMLAFFNGLTMLILSMLGEYLVRLLSQVSFGTLYHVRDTIDGRLTR